MLKSLMGKSTSACGGAVMDALIQIDLDVVLKNKRHLYDEEIWDHMNEKACGQIRSCLTKEVKYLVKDEEFAMTLWRTLEEKYLLKSPENRLHAMSQVYGFRMKSGVSMHDHVSRFEKLLADLKNLDEDIKDEVKAMILLHSLPKEYNHFVTTLIYGKSVIVFKDVCTTLTSLEIRNNDKISERASSEALESFTDFRNLKSGAVVMGNDQPCRTIGIGTIRLKMFDGMVRELKEVRFVPPLKKNLISVGVLKAKGYKVTIEDGIMKFTHGAMVILQGVRRHNLYYLKGGTTDEANVVEMHSDTTELWHVRLGYAEEKSLQTLTRHRLLKGTKTCKLNFYEHCVVGKKTRVKFGTANHDTREILEYVYSDVWGPTKTASIGGSHYFVTVVDDFSRRNGVAERMNRTLLEKVRCMLSKAGLDKKFWVEAVSYASYLVNQLPSAAIGGKTPMEMWSGKHAQDYDSLRIFGCPSYYHVKDGKLDPRARKVIFVGFKGGVKGFKLWDLKDKKFVYSRDVIFDEASMMKASSSQQMENKTKEVLQRVEFDATPYVPVSSTSKKGSTMEVTPRVEEEVVSSDVPQNEETIDDVDNDDFIATRRPRRKIKKPGWLTKDMVVAYALPVIDDDIPNTFVAENELELTQLDVKTTFLHGDLEEEIYMIQPCGFRVARKENHVCRSEHDHCVYFRRLPDGVFIYLLLYVDDMLIASKNRDEIERLKKQLAFEFEMKDLGDAQRILGMEIHRDKKNGSVWLTQKSYLKKVLERFGIDDKTKPVCTPLAPHFKLSSSSRPRSQEERDYMARVPYASVVGSLMYVMVCTRPNISQAVSIVSKYMYNLDCGQQCVGYCDSDFAGDLDKQRSTTGYYSH
ncbi:Integrase catalytic domain-containing protein [Citrus sinensis]|uniref:Integrase catalytic domain-containing protein n=1 Tax=Citrus sinensis TaxID=2711 RepID=A0ACB8MAB2_CITSI|nr:Integrase catalytic domain-containing protein [Citrus sinensis]